VKECGAIEGVRFGERLYCVNLAADISKILHIF